MNQQLTCNLQQRHLSPEREQNVLKVSYAYGRTVSIVPVRQLEFHNSFVLEGLLPVLVLIEEGVVEQRRDPRALRVVHRPGGTSPGPRYEYVSK